MRTRWRNSRMRLVLAGALLVAVVPALPAWAATIVPTQFIMKTYTEALGRSPNATEWAAAYNNFSTDGMCTANDLQAWGDDIFLSSEYTTLYSTPTNWDARVLTVYRGILNSEPPSQTNFDQNVADLTNGVLTWTQFVTAAYDSTEFTTNLKPKICNTTGDDPSNYWFGSASAVYLETAYVSQATLQTDIDNAAAGATITLAQKTVVRLDGTGPLVIKAGKKLTTSGAPGTAAYALQARLVRYNNFTPEGCDGGAGERTCSSVEIEAGGKMENIWFDGQVGKWTDTTPNGGYDYTNPAIIMMGGADTTVKNSRISNWNGRRAIFTTSEDYGEAVGSASYSCGTGTCYWECDYDAGDETIVDGVFAVAYNHTHYDTDPDGNNRTDGISGGCENSLVQNNTVVDATDMPLVMFGSDDDQNNKSIYQSNTVIQAGLSTWGSIGADAGGAATSASWPFEGAKINSNTVWTSSRTHAEFGYYIGWRMSNGNNAHKADGDTTLVSGAGWFELMNNKLGLDDGDSTYETGEPQWRGEQGMNVNAGYDVKMTGNAGAGGSSSLVNVDTSGCSQYLTITAGVTAGWASFISGNQSYTNHDASNCLSHN